MFDAFYESVLDAFMQQTEVLVSHSSLSPSRIAFSRSVDQVGQRGLVVAEIRSPRRSRGITKADLVSNNHLGLFASLRLTSYDTQ